MILARLRALLDSLDRKFEVTHETRLAPRGTVHWTEYSSRSLDLTHVGYRCPARFRISQR